MSSIFPTVLGRGIRLFPQDWKGSVTLEESAQLDSGIVMLKYIAA